MHFNMFLPILFFFLLFFWLFILRLEGQGANNSFIAFLSLDDIQQFGILTGICKENMYCSISSIFVLYYSMAWRSYPYQAILRFQIHSPSICTLKEITQCFLFAILYAYRWDLPTLRKLIFPVKFRKLTLTITCFLVNSVCFHVIADSSTPCFS